jgi:predicted transcriptional regulator
MTKNEQVSLRVPADIREDIERLAEVTERSMAWHMVKAIREYVQRELPKFGKTPKSSK